nr:hemerythrin domain-containing protein [Micromonospora sp. CB01531]
MHRMGTTMLAEATRHPSAELAALDELRVFLVKNLRHHHNSEDDRLWPLIEQVAPGTAAPLADLTGEHEELDRALDELMAAPAGEPAFAFAAEQVRDIVHRHLDHEEPVLLPALREHVTEQAWDEFSAYVMSTVPPDAAYLAIGFFDRIATPNELEVLIGGMPEPVAQLVPMFRQQARATFTALGAD